jgi:hypothetical protein
VKIKHLNPRKLSFVKKEKISKACHPVAVKAFGTPITYEDVFSHVTEPEILLLAYEVNEIVSFGSFAFLKKDGIKILHLHGICVLPEIQGQGCFNEIVCFAGDKFNADVITARTQNPCLYKAMKKVSAMGATYPNYENATSEFIKSIARFVVKQLDLKENLYNPDDMTFKNVYEKCLYPKIPSTRDRKLNRFFSQKIKITRGVTRNAMLVVSELTKLNNY